LVAAQANGAQKDGISVSISLDKKEFHWGEPMQLTVKVTNIGQKPLLVPNFFYLFAGQTAHLEIELSNRKGLLSPHRGFAIDKFPDPSKDKRSPSEIYLNSFVLLHPGTSIVQRIALFQELSVLEYEVKPGAYKLQGYYSTSGLLFPQNLGLTAEDVKSLPFEAWHGKLPTNEVSFTVLPRASR
jgi:hypothetical protein